jgi:hypothetical protein
MNFRSDFTVIAYTKSSGDDFTKAGRTWIYLRMTEDGMIIPRPFFTVMRPYGNINGAQYELIIKHIKTAIDENFGVSASDWKPYDGLASDSVSINCTGWGRWSGSRAPYIDWSHAKSHYPSFSALQKAFNKNPEGFTQSKLQPGEAFPYDNTNYPDGNTIILNFPDPLTLSGQLTASGILIAKGGGGTSKALGILGDMNETTCSITGKQILTRDALQMPDGKWVSHEAAVAIIENKPDTAIEVKEEEVVVEATEEVDVADIDVEDF